MQERVARFTEGEAKHTILAVKKADALPLNEVQLAVKVWGGGESLARKFASWSPSHASGGQRRNCQRRRSVGRESVSDRRRGDIF